MPVAQQAPKVKLLFQQLDHGLDWNHPNLTEPFWRLYWNPHGRSRMIFPHKEVEMGNDKIYLIPPETNFSCETLDPIDHFYIHFQADSPYESLNSDHITFPLNPYRNSISRIIAHLDINENTRASMLSYALCLDLLTQVDEQLLTATHADARINASIEHMKENIDTPLSNEELARRHQLNANAYNRYFKTQTGKTLQQYYMNLRIDEACLMLRFSEKSIDEIASATGFVDRFHFTRTFSRFRRYSPAKYRKRVT